MAASRTRCAAVRDEVSVEIDELPPHPLIGFPYVNRLSTREMDSLTAICDTLLPSVQPPSALSSNRSLRTFFLTSASDAGIPDRLGGFMSGRLQHVALWMMRLALWFLSTWYGTFAICGWASLSSDFPFFQKFSQVDPHKREQILLSLSLSSFFLYRMLFKALKFMTTLLYFTQVDEKNDNPSWKALDYCGPDPDRGRGRVVPGATRAQQEDYYFNKEEEDDDEEEEEEEIEERAGPLCRALLHLEDPASCPTDSIAETLEKAGFPISRSGGGSGRSTSTNKERPPLPSLTIHCDAVVVGSGSGGGVVAGVLAKAGYKVLVLDKGNYYARRNLSLLEGPTMDQMYEGGGLLATEDLGMVVLAGSAVGGGSAVNWSASIRTPDHVRKEWCDGHGLELFGSKAYEEALEVVCRRMGVQAECNEEGLNNAVLRRGCQELGYPHNDIPRNAPSDHYCGWCCFGCKDGKKQGTQETWLVDLARSGNGFILPGCKVLRVLQERNNVNGRKRAVGVVFRSYRPVHERQQGGGYYQGWSTSDCVVQSKVTIVACGALGTPVLLKRSGLRNPNIGKHLHLHPVVMAWGYFPDHQHMEEEKEKRQANDMNWMEGEGSLKKINKMLQKQKKSYEGGIMTAMSTVVGNFEGSGYGAVIQTPALHPGMFSVVMPWCSGLDFKQRMSRFSRTAHIFALARDRGSGEVSSYQDSVSLRYRLDAGDEENLGKGMEKMLRILAAAGAEEIGTHHCRGEGLNVKRASSHEFERFVRREKGRKLRDWGSPVCSAHQMGSCRMGLDPKESAVSERGETWEVEDLFVADSSVFPTALGVNPMVTVQAIAYSTAHSLLQVLSRKKASSRPPGSPHGLRPLPLTPLLL